MDFSRNMLSGELPATLVDCQMLGVLNLSENQFRGTIPSTLNRLIGLTILNLSHNHFSGPIPSSLDQLRYLQKLDLSYNDLGGQVPTAGVYTNTSVVALTGNPHLCGGPTAFNLPTCKTLKEHSNLLAIHLSAGFGMFFFVLVFCAVAFFIWKRKVRRDVLLASIPSRAYGSVYKGVLQNGQIVAIKVLHLTLYKAYKSFLVEYSAQSNIRHRNLLKIIASCSDFDLNGLEFRTLVFKFMSNESLESWLHVQEDLSLIKRLGIAIDIASALHYLHDDFDVPIVHCDLKPSNVLLDDNMNAQVADFGLSKFLGEDRLNNPSSSFPVRGSIGYIAPEYGTGQVLSTEGDVYSFNILLLELFTGRRPTDEMFTKGFTLPDFVRDQIHRGTPAVDLVIIQSSHKQQQKSANVFSPFSTIKRTLRKFLLEDEFANDS